MDLVLQHTLLYIANMFLRQILQSSHTHQFKCNFGCKYLYHIPLHYQLQVSFRLSTNRYFLHNFRQIALQVVCSICSNCFSHSLVNLATPSTLLLCSSCPLHCLYEYTIRVLKMAISSSLSRMNLICGHLFHSPRRKVYKLLFRLLWRNLCSIFSSCTGCSRSLRCTLGLQTFEISQASCWHRCIRLSIISLELKESSKGKKFFQCIRLCQLIPGTL